MSERVATVGRNSDQEEEEACRQGTEYFGLSFCCEDSSDVTAANKMLTTRV